MALYFVTGNKNKLIEVQSVLPQVEQIALDLPEIQALSAEEVIQHKLLAALTEHPDAEFIVEDTSVYMEAFNWELPGPFIKWFSKTLGNEGLAHAAEKLDKKAVRAAVIFGYAKNGEDIHYFSGELEGSIVSPRGDNGFGWDPIFIPLGSNKTLAEMTFEKKNAISMRMNVLKKLKDFLESKQLLYPGP